MFPVRPPASLAAAALFLVSAALSFFLVAAINFLVGLIAIRTKSILGILRAKYLILELLSGLLIPTTLFPEPFRSVLFASPFPHINYTPAALYLGKLSGMTAAADDRPPGRVDRGIAGRGAVGLAALARADHNPGRMKRDS